VARALINQPNLILADEATGNLDEVNETLVMGLLTELHSEGHTILLVTHDPKIGRMAERPHRTATRPPDGSLRLPTHEEELMDDLLKASGTHRRIPARTRWNLMPCRNSHRIAPPSC